MRYYTAVVCFAVFTCARTEPPPHVPSGSYLPGTDGYHYGGSGGSGHVGGGGSGSSGSGHFGGGGSFGGGGDFGSSGGFGGASSFGGEGSFGGGSGFGGGGIFGGGNFGGGGFGIQGGGGGQEQRSVYFFSAPETGEQQRLRIFVAPNNARNTKIIFVKAPSYGSVRPEIIAPPSQIEDKTLVYVLARRPENGGSITIPTTLTSTPTRPQVYYVNYNNQQDAERAVVGGIHGHAVGSGVQDLGSKQAFLGTIHESSHGGGSFGGSFGGGSIGGKYGPPSGSGPY